MLQSLPAFTFDEALLLFCIALLIIVVPVLTYSRVHKYHKRRQIEGARLAILLMNGGWEANLLALALLQIRALRWWPAFNGFVIGSGDFATPLALILMMGLLGVGLMLVLVGANLMPDGLRDRSGRDTANAPR